MDASKRICKPVVCNTRATPAAAPVPDTTPEMLLICLDWQRRWDAAVARWLADTHPMPLTLEDRVHKEIGKVRVAQVARKKQ